MVPALDVSYHCLQMHYRWGKAKFYLSLERNTAALKNMEQVPEMVCLREAMEMQSALPSSAEGIKEVELFYLMVRCKWVRFSMPAK